MQVTKDMTIQQIIELDGQGTGIAEILMNAGMHCLGCAMAHGENLEQACAVHGINAEAVEKSINEYLETL